MPIAVDLAEPRFDIEQGHGQTALTLIGFRSVLYLRTPFFYLAMDGYQAIGRLKGQTQGGKYL